MENIRNKIAFDLLSKTLNTKGLPISILNRLAKMGIANDGRVYEKRILPCQEYEKDENGDYVLDARGAKIPIGEVHFIQKRCYVSEFTPKEWNLLQRALQPYASQTFNIKQRK